MIDRQSLWRLVTLVVLAAAGVAVAVSVGVPSLAQVRGQVARVGQLGRGGICCRLRGRVVVTAAEVGAQSRGRCGVRAGRRTRGCPGGCLRRRDRRVLPRTRPRRRRGPPAHRATCRSCGRSCGPPGPAGNRGRSADPGRAFTAVNYLAGLTAMRARVFTVGTALGIVPATSAYVALGGVRVPAGLVAVLVGIRRATGGFASRLRGRTATQAVNTPHAAMTCCAFSAPSDGAATLSGPVSRYAMSVAAGRPGPRR